MINSIRFRLYLFTFWTNKYAELAVSSCSLHGTIACADNYHRITVKLRKTLKSEDSQASSGSLRSVYFQRFLFAGIGCL